MVQFWEIMETKIVAGHKDFNSTMVQFWAEAILVSGQWYRTFQFHYGAILGVT